MPTLSPQPLLAPSPATPLAIDDDDTSLPLLLLIFLAFIAIVIAAIYASFRFLVCLFSRCRSSSSSPPLSPFSLSISSDDSELITSLPIFTPSTLQKSQSDCAVCLYNFRPHDQLRIMPACRHAFHSQCVDRWLRSTPSCPLCRASIHFNSTSDFDPSQTGSYSRSYSSGSSFEYLVEDDVEAVLERMRRLQAEGKPESSPISEVAEIAGSEAGEG